MRIGFVTLFPEMVRGAICHSILMRAAKRGLLGFETANPRDFAYDEHRTVDDSPYGGGAGMVMTPAPVGAAIDWLLQALGGDSAVVLTDPTGHVFDQASANGLAASPAVVFVCGHYEGIDDRVRERYATHVFSIGDFILTGGELPALVMADAVARLVPGVLGSADSLGQDSHQDGLLSAPQFTRPDEWQGIPVPEVLRGGDHRKIADWRRRMALTTTRAHRPDLFAKASIAKRDLDLLSS